MHSSKRKTSWSSVLFFLVDRSKADCVADLLEEFHERDDRDGRLRAIKWLCKQLVSSSAYLIPKPHLKFTAWLKESCTRFKESCTRLVEPSNLVPIQANRLAFASRIPLTIRSPVAILGLAILLTVPFLYSYVTYKRQLRSNAYKELLALNERVDSRLPVVVLEPTSLMRGGGNSTTRVEVEDSTQVIHFQLELPKEHFGGSYGVDLKAVDAGRLVTLMGLNTRDGKHLSIVLPRSLIPNGDYLLTLLDAQGNSLQEYNFRLKSKQNGSSDRTLIRTEQ